MFRKESNCSPDNWNLVLLFFDIMSEYGDDKDWVEPEQELQGLKSRKQEHILRNIDTEFENLVARRKELELQKSRKAIPTEDRNPPLTVKFKDLKVNHYVSSYMISSCFTRHYFIVY